MQSNPVYVPIHSSSHTVQVCQKEEDRVVERELEFVSEEVKAAEKELQEKPKLPQRVYLEEVCFERMNLYKCIYSYHIYLYITPQLCSIIWHYFLLRQYTIVRTALKRRVDGLTQILLQ